MPVQFGILIWPTPKSRYHNLRAAVKKIVRGQRREETTRFVAFRSHWRFQAEFCTPGGAHEKAASKARVAISAASTGCRFPWLAMPMI